MPPQATKTIPTFRSHLLYRVGVPESTSWLEMVGKRTIIGQKRDKRGQMGQKKVYLVGNIRQIRQSLRQK